MVKQCESVGSFGQSHAMHIGSVSTTSIGLSDFSVEGRQKQTAEGVIGFVASSLQGLSPVLRTVCIRTVFSKAVLDWRSKLAEVFWG